MHPTRGRSPFVTSIVVSTMVEGRIPIPEPPGTHIRDSPAASSDITLIGQAAPFIADDAIPLQQFAECRGTAPRTRDRSIR